MPSLYDGNVPFVEIFNMWLLCAYFVCCLALRLVSVSILYTSLLVTSIFGLRRLKKFN